MIDPHDCTNFHRTREELQEFFLFCVFVAGKRADMMAQKLDQFLDGCTEPFVFIEKLLKSDSLEKRLRECRTGQYRKLTKCLPEAIKLDLKSCSVCDLEKIHGIGPKTARYFVLHTRKNAEIAVLDTHILRFMREELGLETPKSTPTGKRYLQLERAFLDFARKKNEPVAVLDLQIWRKYTKSMQQH